DAGATDERDLGVGLDEAPAPDDVRDVDQPQPGETPGPLEDLPGRDVSPHLTAPLQPDDGSLEPPLADSVGEGPGRGDGSTARPYGCRGSTRTGRPRTGGRSGLARSGRSAGGAGGGRGETAVKRSGSGRSSCRQDVHRAAARHEGA